MTKKDFDCIRQTKSFFLLFLWQFVCLEISLESVDLAIDAQVCEERMLENENQIAL